MRDDFRQADRVCLIVVSFFSKASLGLSLCLRQRQRPYPVHDIRPHPDRRHHRDGESRDD